MEPVDPPPKKYELKPREFERLNRKDPAGKGAEHDVHAILEQNRSAEQRMGLDTVTIRPAKSRRKRDYWLLLLTVNSVFASVGWLGRANVVVLVFVLAGLVMFNLSLAWIMWVLVDDY